MRTLASVLAIAVLVLLAPGCKGSCRQLSETLCDCAGTTTERDNCLRTASTNETNNPPSAAQEDACNALLEQCDCRLIDTPEGRVKCGLARPPFDAGS